MAAGVLLDWTASTDNLGVAGYNIYRSINGSFGALYATTTALLFVDDSVADGVSYTYGVKAVDASGNVGVVRYQIYRSANGTFGPLWATTTNTTFVNGSVTPGVSYTYAVKAVDAAGNVSWRSNLATRTAS